MSKKQSITSSENHPYALLDTIAAPVFVLREGKIEYANPAACKLTGKEPAELIKTEFLDWLEQPGEGSGPVPVTGRGGQPAAVCLETAQRPEVDEVLECSAHLNSRADQARAVRMAFRRADPALIPAEDAVPRVMVTITSAAEQAQAGPGEAAHQRELLEVVFAADPGALAVVSGPELIHRMVNPAYRTFLPDARVDPIGQRYADLWSDGQAARLTGSIRQVIERGEPLDIDRYEMNFPDGSPRYAALRIRPLHWNGEPGALLVIWDITELEESRLHEEQVLADSRRRADELNTVLNALPDAIILYDESGHVQTLNPAARSILGFNPDHANREEILNRVEIYREDGGRARVADMPSSQAMKGQLVRDQRMQISTPDGRQLQVLVSAVPIYSGERLAGAVSIWSDVSELAQRRLELEALVQVAAALRNTIVQEEMFPTALNQIMELMKLDGASIVMPDPATGDLVVRAAAGEWLSTLDQRLPAGAGISTRVITSGQPYMNNDIQNDPVLARAIFAGDLCCGGCVPLRVQDMNIGVLWVGRNRPIEEGELHLLVAIADMAASGLHRASLFEQTQLRLQRLSALHSIDMAITSSLDLQLTLSVLLDQVVSQMRVDAADILLYDPALHWLEFASGRGFLLPTAQNEPQRLAETPAGQVALDRQVLSIPDLGLIVPSTERWLSPQEGFRSYFAAPLISKGQVKGVLELFRREVFHPDSEWLEFLETLATQAAIALDSAELFTRLQRSNEDLRQAYDATIEGWSRALELRDRETEGHSRRVTDLTIRLARRMGISDEEIAHYRRGVLLHDIGKMAIPDEILLKDGPLTPEEQEVMRLHPIYAYDLLKPIAYLRPALDIPYSHHEWWDGRGYPRGLKGEEIPLAARIFTVIDVYDALTNKRTYRPPWPEQKVIEYIRARSGIQFDPRAVDEFIKMIQGYDRFRSLPA